MPPTASFHYDPLQTPILLQMRAASSLVPGRSLEKRGRFEIRNKMRNHERSPDCGAYTLPPCYIDMCVFIYKHMGGVHPISQVRCLKMDSREAATAPRPRGGRRPPYGPMGHHNRSNFQNPARACSTDPGRCFSPRGGGGNKLQDSPRQLKALESTQHMNFSDIQTPGDISGSYPTIWSILCGKFNGKSARIGLDRSQGPK